MTPLRSDMMPPIAAQISGVAKRSIPAVSADHTNTLSRLPSPDFTATTATIAPSTAMTTAIQPSRRSPSRAAYTPAATPAAAITSDTTGVRIMIGGRAMYAAMTPSAMPTQAAVRAEIPVRDAASVDALMAPAPIRPRRARPAGAVRCV